MPVVSLVIAADPSCNLSTNRSVGIIKMLTRHTSIPHLDLVGRCCCKEYNASIFYSIHLQESAQKREQGRHGAYCNGVQSYACLWEIRIVKIECGYRRT
jgi:hypothetical protein